MKEDFLHYVWKYKLFSMVDLKTTNNSQIKILNSGVHNINSGPDFLNSKILIDDLLWAGNIEIHIKSSDWYVHNHEIDSNYDTIILHIVWEYDTEIFDKNNKPIPTLELKNLIDSKLLSNYQRLLSKNLKWIPCEKLIATVDKFVIKNWLERLYFERLEQKSIIINELLSITNNDYEAVLFQLLAKNYGLKVNGDTFLKLAKSINFSTLRKERFDLISINALLFGQAGFLSENIEDSYYQELKNEYKFLQSKYQINPINKEEFKFFRMRPTNFPTVRIAQLAEIYHKHQNLFSELMSFTKIEDYYNFFSVELSEFWKTHYTFKKTSHKRVKKTSKSFVDLLLINTIIPLKFSYLKSKGEINEDDFLGLIKQIKSEKNSIISKFDELKIKSKNAFESQALLELKNSFCTMKRCLHCAIGNKLLNENKL